MELKPYKISPHCPYINARNWQECNKIGWRWLRNLYLNQPNDNKLFVEYLQFLHGERNVALGHPWDPNEQLRPEPSAERFGVYVRDIEEILDEFRKEMDDTLGIL